MKTLQQIAEENKVDQWTARALLKAAHRRGIEPDTEAWRALMVESMPRAKAARIVNPADRVISLAGRA